MTDKAVTTAVRDSLLAFDHHIACCGHCCGNWLDEHLRYCASCQRLSTETSPRREAAKLCGFGEALGKLCPRGRELESRFSAALECTTTDSVD